MAGIVMIDGNPIELGAEVLFHLRHQRARVLFQVAKLVSVFRRHDHPELMTIIFAARDECSIITMITIWTIEIAAVAITINTIPLDVFQVGVERCFTDAFSGAGDMGLDDHSAHSEFGEGMTSK
ncbi:MAG: hypothetical protein AAGF94_18765 [Pseudomonadota bacterium]